MADPIPTPNAFTPDMQAQFNDLMALSTGRAARQEPIHQAAMAMATRMAPSYARDAMSPARAPSTPGAAGGGTGTGTGPDAGGGSNAKMMAAFLAAMLPALAGGGGDLSSLLALFKKLFGRGGPTVQGNKPFAGGALTGPTGAAGSDPFAFRGFAPPPKEANPYDDPTANVDTSFTTSYPNDVFNDPYFLNSQWNGMPNDPSGGTGIGPGMWGYRRGGPGSDDPIGPGGPKP